MIDDQRWTKIICDSLIRIRKAGIGILVAIYICCLVRVVSSGSCSEAKLCCSGRDSSCVVQKTPMNVNAVAEDMADEKPCYCDHACLKLGDCCADFKKTCNVADCLVSSWNEWSECDANCGTGMMWRTRTVVQHALNGGKHCPVLIQKRACLGTSCPQNPRSALKEIAMLLPVTISFKSTRFDRVESNSNITAHRRRSGPFKLEKLNEIAAESHTRKLYCVLFQVVKATKACKKDSSFSALSEGEKVCVQCDSEAMRPSLGYRCSGHGTMDRSTSWSALSAPHCHGRWVRMALDGSPSSSSSAMIATCRLCPGGPQYVFV